MSAIRSWIPCLALAQAQGGVIRREQILALGVAERTLERLVHDGALIAHGRRVYTMPGLAQDLALRSRVVGQRLPRGVLTGVSAAALLGSGPWEGVALGDQPWIVHPPRDHVPARYIAHPRLSMKRANGVCVADAPYVVVDLVRFLPRDPAFAVGFRAIQTSVVTVAWMKRRLGVLRGYRGAAQLREFIAFASSGAHSYAEQLFHRRMRAAAIHGWTANLRVRIEGRLVVIDVAFAHLKIAVEIDGRQYHSQEERFQADRIRQNLLVRAGWLVLRFTWEDLTERPDEVVRQVLDAVALRTAQQRSA